MALSKCPKCESTNFEVVVKEPSKSNYKLIFVQCGSCGCVVGTMDYFNIGTKIAEVEKKVDALSLGASNLHSVNNNLDVINRNVLHLQSMVQSLKISQR